MRFQGKHIWQVLPRIFEETAQNKEFVQDQKQREGLEVRFDEGVQDVQFDRFYKSLNVADQ